MPPDFFHYRPQFVNVAGRVRIEEPGTALAVALAVASSFTAADFPTDMVAFGASLPTSPPSKP